MCRSSYVVFGDALIVDGNRFLPVGLTNAQIIEKLPSVLKCFTMMGFEPSPGKSFLYVFDTSPWFSNTNSNDSRPGAQDGYSC